MNKIIFFICIFIAGCSFCRTTTIKVDGKDIKSPYATGDGNIVYNAVTQFDFMRKCDE